MNERELRQKISELESVNDQLIAEMHFLNDLLVEVGFEEGLESLKAAAKELIEIEKETGTG